MGPEWRPVAQSHGPSLEIRHPASQRLSPRRSLFDLDLGGLVGNSRVGHPGVSFLSACPTVRMFV
jgi:hypothetical protein